MWLRSDAMELRSDASLADYALVFAGSVSQMHADTPFSNSLHSDVRASGATYTPLAVTAAAFYRHVVLPNGGRQAFDVYVHTWTMELRSEMTESCSSLGVLRASAFENSSRLLTERVAFSRAAATQRGIVKSESDWRQLSWSISLSRAAAALLRDVLHRRRGVPHRRVLFTRPDLMLIADVRFDAPSRVPRDDVAYVPLRAAPLPPRAKCCVLHGEFGDFYAITSSAQTLEAVASLPSIVFEHRLRTTVHRWMALAFKQRGLRLLMDGIAPGRDVDVYRKLPQAGPMLALGERFYAERYNMTRSQWAWLERSGRAHQQAGAAARVTPRHTLVLRRLA